MKQNPLPFHKDARPAAMAALAAAEQGKFREMHELIFENSRALKPDKLEGYAQKVGLNVAKYKAFMDGNKGEDAIKADQKLARSLGASGTPAFFINGRNLSGAQPQASFEKVIDEELKKAKALLGKGIARNKVYAETIKNGATSPKFLPGSGKPASKARQNIKVGPNDPYKGGKTAKVTVVEWTDYQ